LTVLFVPQELFEKILQSEKCGILNFVKNFLFSNYVN